MRHCPHSTRKINILLMIGQRDFSISELASRHNVSVKTVRRDLELFERMGIAMSNGRVPCFTNDMVDVGSWRLARDWYRRVTWQPSPHTRGNCNSGQFKRLLELLHRLHGPQGLTMAEMSAAFDVSYKTAFRDVTCLAMIDVPIHNVTNAGGGEGARYRWHLDPRWARRFFKADA